MGLADREAVEDHVSRGIGLEHALAQGVVVRWHRLAARRRARRVGVGHPDQPDSRGCGVLPPVVAEVGCERLERRGGAVDVAVDHARAESGRP
jgi:hypothetical protein